MKIAYLNEVVASEKKSDWQLVAKIWPHKTKESSFSGKFGVKIKKNGELLDVFESITVTAGDPLMIRKANFKGDNAPSHLIYMLKDAKVNAK